MKKSSLFLRKNMILILIFLVFVFVLWNVKYYELKVTESDYAVNSSMIGLTINGSSTTTFPNKESGLAIGSIVCDKGANGVWDYDNWMLKVRGVNQSRTKCQINFVSKYYESILNGTDPVLKDGLIPVKISNLSYGQF